MTETVVVYVCHIAGNTHCVPGEDVRILRVGDGGFVIACNCGPESLEGVDEPPHETVDHLVNIYADDPSPEDWLRLETAAEGWHDVDPWNSPDNYEGTYRERRANFKERVKRIADDIDGRGFNESDREKRAKQVSCPDCGANVGEKCKRPSGHTVATPHAERIEKAVNKGILEQEGGENGGSRQQTGLGEFATCS
jgi:hypothetical protein